MGRGRLPHGETADANLARVRDYADTAVDTSVPTGGEMLPGNAAHHGRSEPGQAIA